MCLPNGYAEAPMWREHQPTSVGSVITQNVHSIMFLGAYAKSTSHHR